MRVRLPLWPSLKLSPSERHIVKTVSQELHPSDGRSCNLAADGHRPCDGARRCQAFSFSNEAASPKQGMVNQVVITSCESVILSVALNPPLRYRSGRCVTLCEYVSSARTGLDAAPICYPLSSDFGLAPKPETVSAEAGNGGSSGDHIVRIDLPLLGSSHSHLHHPNTVD